MNEIKTKGRNRRREGIRGGRKEGDEKGEREKKRLGKIGRFERLVWICLYICCVDMYLLIFGCLYVCVCLDR